LDEDQRTGSSDLRVAQQTGTYTYADHSRFQSLSFRTALVAKKRIQGKRGTIRDSYNPLIAAVLADASHRHPMVVAATIADQLPMDRPTPSARWRFVQLVRHNDVNRGALEQTVQTLLPE
jgi:hypothetical protein